MILYSDDRQTLILDLSQLSTYPYILTLFTGTNKYTNNNKITINFKTATRHRSTVCPYIIQVSYRVLPPPMPAKNRQAQIRRMFSGRTTEAIDQDIKRGTDVSKNAFFLPIRSIMKPIAIAPIGVQNTRMLAKNALVRLL